MRKPLILLALLFLLAGSCAGYFSVPLILAASDYFSFSASASAAVSRWEVREIEGRFAMRAIYSFDWQGNTWSGAELFGKPRPFSEAAAIASLKKKAKLPCRAFFNPNNPARSSLEKKFPVELLVKTAVCLGILVYFIFLSKKILNRSV